MAEAPGFGLYVHWPFCQAKCPYCDFNSHVAATIEHDVWASAYEREIARLSRETGPRKLDSIFFGGGTPSLMQAKTVERVLDAARAGWSFANDIEITLEANPTSVEAGRFEDFRTAGVNRVSVGLQALNDHDLKALGRLHSADEGRAAFDVARSVFERASFDLIYGRQGQTLSDWESELAQALALGADHMSLYQLTIEPGTAFGDRYDRGKLPGLPDNDLGADMFAITQAMTAAADLPAYEISNHAHEGHECTHNLIYWNGGDWAAVGPGAHGRLTLDGLRLATEAPRGPKLWLDQVSDGASPEQRETLTWTQTHEEKVMMGLRLASGINVDVEEEKVIYINTLSENHLINYEAGTLRLTEHGRPLLNAVLKELLA